MRKSFTAITTDGASLIYTSTSDPNSLPTLIHSTLGIHSLLKKQSLKHNVIDKDKIIILPNWDSWGKIQVLREGFDIEGISSAWSIDIQQQSQSSIPDSMINRHESVAQPEDRDNPASGQTLIVYENVKIGRAHV